MVLQQRTPLMVAATYGSLDMMKLIVAAGPAGGVNWSCFPDGSTTLHCAASGGSLDAVEAVRILLAAGADVTAVRHTNSLQKGFLTRYVKHLKDINFLKEDLVFSVHSVEGTDSGVDTYFGLCTYPGREQRHRIDIKVYPRGIFAFGLIAWTGNDVLNRRLRLLADSKGYRLDDTGLYLATQSSEGKKGTKSSTSLKFKTEKEVFAYLDFPWLEPHERNL